MRLPVEQLMRISCAFVSSMGRGCSGERAGETAVEGEPGVHSGCSASIEAAIQTSLLYCRGVGTSVR